jgi:hypothetical protein
MKKEYICYCGLYCENCAVKAKIGPAASVLYDEMVKMGFSDVIEMIPGGSGFWAFLKDMAENGMCVSCKVRGGDPGCKVRICAKEKGIEMCAFCDEYPCGLFDRFAGYPTFRKDNELLREKGIVEWGKMQDARRKRGYVFTDHNDQNIR